MSTGVAAQVVDPKTGRTKAIRTYSRRRLVRRFSSPLIPPPIQHEQPRLTQSFHAAPTPRKTSIDEKRDFGLPRPKRIRLSGFNGVKKSPIDLFYEMISSSAPELLLSQVKNELDDDVLPSIEADDRNSEEVGSLEKPRRFYRDKIELHTYALEAAADELGSQADEHEELATKMESDIPVLNDGSEEEDEDEDQIEDGTEDGTEGEGEDNNDGDEFEELPLEEQPNNPIESLSQSNAWRSSLPPRRSAQMMPKAQGRFLAFKKADDRDDFKPIDKRPKTPASKRLNLTVSKRTGDGFDEDEKQIGSYKRQRRTRGDALIGRLDLTQNEIATQKIEGPTWLKGQKKARYPTISSLWSRRQYVGNSQIKIESQDSLDSFMEETEAHPKYKTRNRNHRTRQTNMKEPDDVDEDEDEVDLLVFPLDAIDVDDGEGDNDEVSLLVEPEEIDKKQDSAVAHKAENTDLVVIPRTDTPQQDESIALDGHSGF